MKYLFIIAALLVATMFIRSYQNDHENLSASDLYVIDGDTIAVGDKRYRLTGYDTPETYRAQCEPERVHGLKAKARLEELIIRADGITLDVKPKPDRHGRLLARAYAGNTDIAALLIAEGLARLYRGGPRRKWCNDAGGLSL